MAKKEIFVGIGVDVDSVAGQIGSYAGGDSPSDISRGVFASEVGTPRMLKLFDRAGIQTSWFIPGHSIETFPKEMKAVAAAGHEIGMHGYTHENPIAMTPEQEADVLDKSLELVTKLADKAPHGLRGAVVGDERVYAASADGARHQVRPQPDAQRLRALLDADQRGVDVDRLFQAGEDVDEADEEGHHLPHRADSGKLVPRRPAAHDVHEEGAELRRLDQPARHRGVVARPVRLGISRDGLRGLHPHHPPRHLRPPADAADAGADHRPHRRPRRRDLGDLRRDRRRLHQAPAVQGRRGARRKK